MRTRRFIQILLFVLVIFFGVGINNDIFALYDGDCTNIAMNKDPVSSDRFVFPYDGIVPLADIQIAVNNLKAYCCDVFWKNTDAPVGYQETCNSFDKPEQYPQSLYFFDHIVDVMMRRLDAEPIELGYQGIGKDKRGEEWRKSIDEIANAPKGNTPLNLQEKFNTAFAHKSYDGDIMGVLRNHDDYTLYERYLSVCDVAENIYSDLASEMAGIMKTASNNLTESEGMYRCRQLVSNRVQAEMDYVKVIMLQRTNDTMKNSVNGYFTTFNDRINNLSDTMLLMKNALFIVTKKIGEQGTKNCSK